MRTSQPMKINGRDSPNSLHLPRTTTRKRNTPPFGRKVRHEARIVVNAGVLAAYPDPPKNEVEILQAVQARKIAMMMKDRTRSMIQAPKRKQASQNHRENDGNSWYRTPIRRRSVRKSTGARTKEMVLKVVFVLCFGC